MFGFLIPWWVKYLAIALFLAGLFGTGYLKGRQHEQEKQNAALVSFYEEQLAKAAKQARADNEAAINAQKELDVIRKDAELAKAQVRKLLANKPIYQQKIDQDVKALINEGLKKPEVKK